MKTIKTNHGFQNIIGVTPNAIRTSNLLIDKGETCIAYYYNNFYSFGLCADNYTPDQQSKMITFSSRNLYNPNIIEDYEKEEPNFYNLF